MQNRARRFTEYDPFRFFKSELPGHNHFDISKGFGKIFSSWFPNGDNNSFLLQKTVFLFQSGKKLLYTKKHHFYLMLSKPTL